MSSETPETIGYCEGICGGLLSHHLVRGLCPQCRADARIRDADPYDEQALGAEADVRHVDVHVMEDTA